MARKFRPIIPTGVGVYEVQLHDGDGYYRPISVNVVMARGDLCAEIPDKHGNKFLQILDNNAVKLLKSRWRYVGVLPEHVKVKYENMAWANA